MSHHFQDGTKVSLFNVAHKHYLHSDAEGKLLCHNAQPNHECYWLIERETPEYCAIKCIATGLYLQAEADGSFNARGDRNSSRFHIENVRDGGIALKAVDDSWFLGISMFGHIETVDSESYDRCHWRVEVAF